MMNSNIQPVPIKQLRLLHEGMLDSSMRYPGKAAVVVEGVSYNYADLRDASMRLAAALVAGGVRRGDRVAIFMDNTWPCVVSIYGATIAGAVFLIINPLTKSDKLEYILKDSGASVLLTDMHLSNVFFQVTEDIHEPLRVIASGNLDEKRLDAGRIESFHELITNTTPLNKAVELIPNDLAALIYTSGSTGFPKGVMQTHQSMVFAAWSLIEYLRLSQHDRIFLGLPIAFDYGLYQLLMAMNLGATLIVERSFTFMGQIYKRIEEQGATVLPGVPTVFAMIISSHKKKKLSFPGILTITNTAAALSPELIPYLREIFPNAKIFKMYGQTECKRVCYLEPELINEKPKSVGKAIPGTEVFLLTPEGGGVAPGQEGILHVRGPHVMVGYWNQPELTKKMLREGKIPGERILCTHDWFRMDEDGYLYFIGRSDEIIKTRGEKVSPVEVENVLLSSPDVKETVVFGMADDTLGQAIVAYVALEAGSKLNEAQLKKYCLAKLENFMVPRDIIVMDTLPKTANGKIDKKLLIEIANK